MLFTIGHSNLPWEQFQTLLFSVSPDVLLIDVRSHPTSKHPQHNNDAIMTVLGRQYQWWPALGGWAQHHGSITIDGQEITAYSHGHFPKQRIASHRVATRLDPTSPTWTNQGLYDYSWYMATQEFLKAAQELIKLAQHQDVAMMCSEALWYKCHRSMISDYAHAHGQDSIHLNGYNTKTKGYQTTRTIHSEIIGNRLQRYDHKILEAWYANTITGTPPCPE